MSFSVDTMNRLMKNHSFWRQIRPLYTCCTMAVNLVQLSLWKFVWDLLLWVPFWKKNIYMVASKYDCIADTCWNIILYCRKTVKPQSFLLLFPPGTMGTYTRTKTNHRFLTRQQLSLSNFWQIFSLFIFWIFMIYMYMLYRW